MRVYIAAPYPERVYAQQVMADLESRGDFEVTSTWLRHEDKLEDTFARLDLADVARADVLVALNPPEYANSGTGGRHVEFGYALALRKPIVMVGAQSNIFHFLDDLYFVALPDLVSTLRRIHFSPVGDNVDRAVARVVAELRRAEAKHRPLNSHHEGYAVLKEEVDELWDDVKANRKAEAIEEAVQVAAMGLRFIVNLSPVEFAAQEVES